MIVAVSCHSETSDPVPVITLHEPLQGQRTYFATVVFQELGLGVVWFPEFKHLLGLQRARNKFMAGDGQKMVDTLEKVEQAYGAPL